MDYQLTESEAIKLHNSEIWANWTPEQIASFQLFQERLCLDFQIFHDSLSKVLKRSIYSHEFGNKELLISEFLKIGLKRPQFEDFPDVSTILS